MELDANDEVHRWNLITSMRVTMCGTCRHMMQPGATLDSYCTRKPLNDANQVDPRPWILGITYVRNVHCNIVRWFDWRNHHKLGMGLPFGSKSAKHIVYLFAAPCNSSTSSFTQKKKKKGKISLQLVYHLFEQLPTSPRAMPGHGMPHHIQHIA